MITPPILAALTHPLGGDAAIGSALIDRVSNDLSGRVWIVDGVDPTDLIGIWAGSPIVVIIEAKRDGASPGTLRRYDLTDASVGVAASRSVGVAEVLAVARALDQAPQQTILLSITVGPVGTDAASAAVLDVLGPAAKLVLSEFENFLVTRPSTIAATKQPGQADHPVRPIA